MVATLRDFRLDFRSVPLLCDNTSAISLANNPVQNSRTKQVDMRFHFLRDHNEKGDIDSKYIDTQHQLSDIFTKPLDFTRLAYLRGELGVGYRYL